MEELCRSLARVPETSIVLPAGGSYPFAAITSDPLLFQQGRCVAFYRA